MTTKLCKYLANLFPCKALSSMNQTPNEDQKLKKQVEEKNDSNSVLIYSDELASRSHTSQEPEIQIQDQSINKTKLYLKNQNNSINYIYENPTNGFEYKANKTQKYITQHGQKAVHEISLLNAGCSTAEIVYFQFNKDKNSNQTSLFITTGYKVNPLKGPFKDYCEKNQISIESNQMLKETFSFNVKNNLKVCSKLIVNNHHAAPLPLASVSLSSFNQFGLVVSLMSIFCINHLKKFITK